MKEAEDCLPALPNLIIIGAMKCGTTALHGLLDRHPDIAMAKGKELNFFFGPTGPPGEDAVSTWHRGLDWYARQFDGRAVIRGEASPGYTSPDHPEAAGRMAAVVPDARLVYLVRDPIDRAVSQYRHHRADGSESRPVAEALLDPESQYVARGRFYERLVPFLGHFAPEQILIIAQEDLLTETDSYLKRIYRFLDMEPLDQPAPRAQRWNVSPGAEVAVPERVRGDLGRAFADDVARLRELTSQEFAHWSI